MSVATLNEQSLNQDGQNFVRVNIGDATATVVFNMFDRDPTLRFTPIRSSFDLTADLTKRVLLNAPAVSLVFTPTGRVVAISNGYFPSSTLTSAADATADLYKRQHLNATATTDYTPTASLYKQQQLFASTSVSFNVVSTGRLMALVSGSIESTYTVTGSSTKRHRLSGVTDLKLDTSSTLTSFVRNRASGTTGIVFAQSGDLSNCKRSQISGSPVALQFDVTGDGSFRGMRTGFVNVSFNLSGVLSTVQYIQGQPIGMSFVALGDLSINTFTEDPITMRRPFADREMRA